MSSLVHNVALQPSLEKDLSTIIVVCSLAMKYKHTSRYHIKASPTPYCPDKEGVSLQCSPVLSISPILKRLDAALTLKPNKAVASSFCDLPDFLPLRLFGWLEAGCSDV